MVPNPKASKPLLKTISISLMTWLFIITVLPILFVYKKIIELILMAIHGERFGGFMDGADSVYLMPNESMDCLINCMLIIRSEKKKDVYRELRTAIQQKILNEPDSYVKLTSSKKSFSGYPYLFKYDCDLEDLISVIDVPKGKRFDKDYIRDVTAALTKKEFPKNNSLLWDTHVSNTPLEEDGNEENKYYRYPIIFRLHHSVGDYTSLIVLLRRILGEEESQKYAEDLTEKTKTGQCQEQKWGHFLGVITKHLKSTINHLKFWTEAVFLAAGRVVQAQYMTASDVNVLHGKQCGEKVIAWTTEGQPEYISRIKSIKKRIPNSTFTSVVMTALLASLSNYFDKNKLPVPEHIQALMPISMSFPKTDPEQPVPLKNRTSGLTLKLPLQESPKNLTDFLRNVSMTMQKQRRIIDVTLNRFFVDYAVGLFPLNIVLNTTAFQSETFLLTNVPGGPQVKALNGCPLELFMPTPPNFYGIGVSIAIVTYDDKFQLSLLADKAVLHSQNEAQKIIDDVLTHISLLDTESQKLSVEK